MGAITRPDISVEIVSPRRPIGPALPIEIGGRGCNHLGELQVEADTPGGARKNPSRVKLSDMPKADSTDPRGSPTRTPSSIRSIRTIPDRAERMHPKLTAGDRVEILEHAGRRIPRRNMEIQHRTIWTFPQMTRVTQPRSTFHKVCQDASLRLPVPFEYSYGGDQQDADNSPPQPSRTRSQVLP